MRSQHHYTTNFEGDEYAAYENLCKGFIEEVKDYADYEPYVRPEGTSLVGE